MQAASIIHNTGKDFDPILFLSDAFSVLQVYQNNKRPSLTQTLKQVTHGRKVVLKWILTYCGVPGNDDADLLTEGEQPNDSISYSEVHRIIR